MFPFISDGFMLPTKTYFNLNVCKGCKKLNSWESLLIPIFRRFQALKQLPLPPSLSVTISGIILCPNVG